ncbi:hypothetical protein [Methylobacter sp.]|uniref:hypothetical protein n=1 Tax=Methylobacter sp. TaxID=2051955 RepID=UPI002487AE24|nr:hypothetical protein [Methylobacter sp.]MDI1277287.1 hypothetical protein [Methylobacter sp.]MDI1357853.1 hypothetical protein [Methylobacter sp.]
MTEQKRGGKRPGAGRKKGTKNKITVDLKNKAGEYSAEAIQVFVDVMRDSDAPQAVRIQAADKLLDRSHGKASIHIDAQHTSKMEPELLERIKTEMIARMEASRERQKQVLIERGILAEEDG